MAQGLRPHHHCCFIYGISRYYDKNKGCMIKKVTYKCMMCDYMTHEIYECYEPPPKTHANSVLQKNKRKYGNR